MKKAPIILTIILLVVVAGGYYFYKSSQAKAKSLKLQTHKEAIDTLRGNENASIKPVEHTKILPDSSLRLLQQYNLSSLWCNPDTALASENRFDGFYGNDHYRIEMYFSEVYQDAELPHIFHVKGKSRYKKNVTPFEGQIRIETVSAFNDPNISKEDMEIKQAYSLKGIFELKEDSTRQGSGIFAGNLQMDFAINNENQVQPWFFTPTTPAQGSGFKFEGQWTSNKTATQKPVIWAKDLFMFANNILKNFSIGERDVEINPKYRHLGWDNYWEVEEWWVESKPIL